MVEILKMLQDFNEDMTDCALGIPVLSNVILGVTIGVYNKTREAMGLRPE